MAQIARNRDTVVQQGATADGQKPLHQDCSDNRRKSVQFNDKVNAYTDYSTAKMRQQMWYDKSDYKRFQLEKRETLRSYRYAQSKFQRMKEDIFCLRGFEACLSHRAVQQRLLRKVAALQAVLETQFDQKRRGIHDPKSIQAHYRKVTAPARKSARERAALDAAEVEEEQQLLQLRPERDENAASKDVAALKKQIDRLMHIKAGAVETSLRSSASGPLMLRKSTANSA